MALPMNMNTPASEPNINNLCVSQSSTMINIASSTMPKQRKKSVTNTIDNNEMNCNQPSSKSVERSSRRVRVIAKRVTATFLIEAIMPS